MKNLIRTLILAPAVLCASAALAADTSTANVPFAFTAHGKSYPAGQYIITAAPERNVVALRSKEQPARSLLAVLMPADGNPNAKIQTKLKFSARGFDHQLRTIQYGTYSTPEFSRPRHRSSYREEASLEVVATPGAGN